MNFTKFETKFSQSQNFREFNASPFDTASENEQEQNSENAPVDNKQKEEEETLIHSERVNGQGPRCPGIGDLVPYLG